MSLQSWRDLAVALLAFETLILSLIPLALLYLAVRGVIWSIRQVHFHAPRVREFFRKMARTTDQIGQRVAAPLISARAGMAGVRRWLSVISSIDRIKERV